MVNYVNSLVKAYPVLSGEEIRSVCYEMHNNSNQKVREENRNRLALSFTPYAFKECKKYIKNINSQDFSDMFAEVIAVFLDKAWDYNPEHSSGACFITFIQNYVNDITSKFYNGDKTKYLVCIMNEISKAQNEYMKIYGKEPTVAELSAFSGMSEKVIRNACARNESYNVVSLNAAPSSSDSDLTYEDMAVESVTCSGFAANPEDIVLGKLQAEKMARVKKQFSGTERFILDFPEMSDRKAVAALKDQCGVDMARTTYQNLKKKTLKKYEMCVENASDNFTALAA